MTNDTSILVMTQSFQLHRKAFTEIIIIPTLFVEKMIKTSSTVLAPPFAIPQVLPRPHSLSIVHSCDKMLPILEKILAFFLFFWDAVSCFLKKNNVVPDNECILLENRIQVLDRDAQIAGAQQIAIEVQQKFPGAPRVAPEDPTFWKQIRPYLWMYVNFYQNVQVNDCVQDSWRAPADLVLNINNKVNFVPSVDTYFSLRSNEKLKQIKLVFVTNQLWNMLDQNVCAGSVPREV